MTLQPRHLLFAALLHLVLFGLLFSGVQCSRHVEPTPVVQGVLINPSDLRRMFPPAPTPQPKPEPTPDQGPQPKVNADTVADTAKVEQEKAEQARRQAEEQQKQEQTLKEEAAKREQLRQQQLAQEQAREQAEQKARQQAEADKQRQEEEKRKAEAAAAEAQRKQAEEQVRLEAQQEQQKQAALEAKHKADAAQKAAAERKRREAELQASLGVESAQLNQQIQNEWSLQLIAAITQAWARPPGTSESLKTWLRITLSEAGEVQSAEVDTSSGVPLFDQSVRQAVYKASPLPLPKDPSAFDPNIKICFSPNPRNCSQ